MLFFSALQALELENTSLLKLANKQVRNVGGKPYWSWYGFSNHVEWWIILLYFIKILTTNKSYDILKLQILNY